MNVMKACRSLEANAFLINRFFFTNGIFDLSFLTYAIFCHLPNFFKG